MSAVSRANRVISTTFTPIRRPPRPADRLVKCDPAQIALANRFVYPVPTYVPVVATADVARQTWKFSFDTPAPNWTTATFDDSAWRNGQSVFGSTNNGLRIATHDDEAEIYLNSQLVVRLGGYNANYEALSPIPTGLF